ncbi:MAG: hypothetical protein RLZZ598_1992 [Pseudomonadota bacterium]
MHSSAQNRSESCDNSMSESGALRSPWSLVPELGVAVARSSDGHELRIRQSTPGVSWEDLRPGQQLVLLVKGVLAPRVLSVVGPDPDK